jgi:hypothetical protein
MTPDAPPLSGHTLPDAGAAIAHDALGVRLALSWDACAASPLVLRERQVTPNHVLYHVGGEPVFGDGAPMHDEGFLDAPLEEIAGPLTDAQREDVEAAFGSVERWARVQQPGLLGAANTVVIDGASGYFPPGERRGRLVHERRTVERHVVTAECVEFFRPRFAGLARARRTVCLNAAGIAWIVDDYATASPSHEHDFAWQAYLRRGCSLRDDHLHVRLGSGRGVTLGWAAGAVADVGLHRFPTYPAAAPPGVGLGWPDAGSERLRLSTRGAAAQFAVCLVSKLVDDMRVVETRPNVWGATWSDGCDQFESPIAP